MNLTRPGQNGFYLWTRDLHLYAGLFLSPFILLFAVTTVLFNHTWKPWTNARQEKTSAPVTVPADLSGGVEGWDKAKEILRQVNVAGEIGFVRYLPQDNRLVIPVFKPGQRITVEVNLETKIADVLRTKIDIWDTLFYLHRTPGPHNARQPRNWIFSRVWGWLADTTVYLMLFVSASGVYLWAVLKAERKVGLLLLGAGMISFLTLLLALGG